MIEKIKSAADAAWGYIKTAWGWVKWFWQGYEAFIYGYPRAVAILLAAYIAYKLARLVI